MSRGPSRSLWSCGTSPVSAARRNAVSADGAPSDERPLGEWRIAESRGAALRASSAGAAGVAGSASVARAAAVAAATPRPGSDADADAPFDVGSGGRSDARSDAGSRVASDVGSDARSADWAAARGASVRGGANALCADPDAAVGGANALCADSGAAVGGANVLSADSDVPVGGANTRRERELGDVNSCARVSASALASATIGLCEGDSSSGVACLASASALAPASAWPPAPARSPVPLATVPLATVPLAAVSPATACVAGVGEPTPPDPEVDNIRGKTMSPANAAAARVPKIAGHQRVGLARRRPVSPVPAPAPAPAPPTAPERASAPRAAAAPALAPAPEPTRSAASRSA